MLSVPQQGLNRKGLDVENRECDGMDSRAVLALRSADTAVEGNCPPGVR